MWMLSITLGNFMEPAKVSANPTGLQFSTVLGHLGKFIWLFTKSGRRSNKLPVLFRTTVYFVNCVYIALIKSYVHTFLLVGS